jgi:hypothetical protein
MVQTANLSDDCKFATVIQTLVWTDHYAPGWGWGWCPKMDVSGAVHTPCQYTCLARMESAGAHFVQEVATYRRIFFYGLTVKLGASPRVDANYFTAALSRPQGWQNVWLGWSSCCAVAGQQLGDAGIWAWSLFRGDLHTHSCIVLHIWQQSQGGWGSFNPGFHCFGLGLLPLPLPLYPLFCTCTYHTYHLC